MNVAIIRQEGIRFRETLLFLCLSMPIWLLGILKYTELVNDGPIAADGLKIMYRLYRNARKHAIMFFSHILRYVSPSNKVTRTGQLFCHDDKGVVLL
jgi:hypothetical protein